MSPVRKFLLQLRDIGRRLDSDVSLESSARRAEQSRFRFHRLFRSLAGETLKRYTLRLRLERAAGELIATDRAICAIALTGSFQLTRWTKLCLAHQQSTQNSQQSMVSRCRKTSWHQL